MTQFVSDEFDLAHRMARIEHENDRLHERMGYWRERAGELEEALGQLVYRMEDDQWYAYYRADENVSDIVGGLL